MDNPKYLSYSKTHEWIDFESKVKARTGISDFAQNSMGDIVFINLPEVGDEVKCGDSFGDVESVKAVSELYSPFSGVVTAVNETLLDNPGLINESPYEAWMIEVDDISETEDLIDADEYAAFCEEENA